MVGLVQRSDVVEDGRPTVTLFIGSAGERTKGGAVNSHESRRKRRDDGSNGTGTMLTMREACRLLNVHGNTLRRWSALGLVRAYRVGAGRQRRFRAEDIAALVVEQTRFASNEHDKC